MLTWNVIPNESVNIISFGQDRNIVQGILGKPKRTIRKSLFSRSTTDVYTDFHVHFGEDGKLESIEFFGNNNEVLLPKGKIYPGKLQDVEGIIGDLVYENGMYYSKKDSIGFTEEDEQITSILIGQKDYYMGRNGK